MKLIHVEDYGFGMQKLVEFELKIFRIK